MSNKPHIYAHCAAGCKWEVPHKSDTPYYEKVATLKNSTLSLGDAVEVAEINMHKTSLLGETVKLTIEVTSDARYQGNLYTAFFTADNTYRNWLIPTDECGFVEMVVSYDGTEPTTVSLTLMTDTAYIVKVKEFVVCQLGAAVFAMTGATATENGKTGTVPQPTAGDNNKTLYGDGTWRTPTFVNDDVALYDEPITAECGSLTSLDLLPCFSSGHNIDIPLPVGATVRCEAADRTVEGVVKQVTVDGYTYNYVGCVMFPDGYYGYDGADSMTEGFCGIASAVGKANPAVMNGAPLIIYRWWASGAVTLNSITQKGVITEVKEYIDEYIAQASDGLLPEVTTDDAGKILRVNDDGTWEAEVETAELPTVTTDDNDKIIQVVNGKYQLVSPENSAVKTYIDNYINEALGGEY